MPPDAVNGYLIDPGDSSGRKSLRMTVLFFQLFLFFPDRLFKAPCACFVLVEDVAVVEPVDNFPEFCFCVAHKLAEVSYAERVKVVVAFLDNLLCFIPCEHTVADVACGDPGQAEMVVDFWMPNKEWEGCDVNDPSARVLSNYGDSGK